MVEWVGQVPSFSEEFTLVSHLSSCICGSQQPGFHTGFFVGEGKKRSRKVTHANT